MPQFTLSDLMSQATARAGRRADIPQSVVSFWANVAYYEVADAIPHALQEKIDVSSTTSGGSRLTLPSDFNEIINVSLNWPSNWSTTANAQRSYQTLSRTYAGTLDSTGVVPVGIPSKYVLFNNWLELDPSPDSGYSLQIRYRSQVTDMVALSDVPSLSTPWRYAVLLKLEQHLHEYVGNTAGSSAAEQRYFTYCQTTKLDETRRQTGEEGLHVHVVW